VLVSVLGLSISACNKLETYDELPIIIESSYELQKNFAGLDTGLVLKFTYTDGDGNVGLSTRDTMPPYDKNVMVDYFEKQGNDFVKILIPGTTDTLNFNSRIKEFGVGNPTKAEVSVKIDIGVVIADTVRFDYYILDKDLNKSNVVSTGPIALKN
jgi:hypothetical protein